MSLISAGDRALRKFGLCHHECAFTTPSARKSKAAGVAQTCMFTLNSILVNSRGFGHSLACIAFARRSGSRFSIVFPLHGVARFVISKPKGPLAGDIIACNRAAPVATLAGHAIEELHAKTVNGTATRNPMFSECGHMDGCIVPRHARHRGRERGPHHRQERQVAQTQTKARPRRQLRLIISGA